MSVCAFVFLLEAYMVFVFNKQRKVTFLASSLLCYVYTSQQRQRN